MLKDSHQNYQEHCCKHSPSPEGSCHQQSQQNQNQRESKSTLFSGADSSSNSSRTQTLQLKRCQESVPSNSSCT